MCIRVRSIFNEEKGFGFITEDSTRESVFVHSNQLQEVVKERDRVEYEKERTPKGYSAIRVKKYKLIPIKPILAPGRSCPVRCSSPGCLTIQN
ncbi:MAG: cold shock domain-containing protein [Bacteroidota bacterium]|nr:MAG: cold shock domain-containing protein [Bacteroidota bacterium]